MNSAHQFNRRKFLFGMFGAGAAVVSGGGGAVDLDLKEKYLFDRMAGLPIIELEFSVLRITS